MKRNAKIALMACVSLFFIFHFSIFNLATAQQPWNYTSVREAHLDDAYFVEPPAPVKAKIQKAVPSRSLGQAVSQSLFNRSYRLSVDKRNRLCFLSDSLSFTLPESTATECLPYLVSHRYWQQRYQTLQQWAFVSMDNRLLIDVDTADHRYGPYSPVTWLGYRFQPSADWPVVFTIRTNSRREQELTLPALQTLAEWGAFTTVAGQEAYEQNLVSRRQAQQAEEEALRQHLDSLDRRSEHVARQADSIAVAMQQDSLHLAELQVMADVQATKEKMNRKTLFLMSVNPARSDYMFGLEFNFYNCFDRVITKIEITVTPVNAKGRIQKDQFNRDVRTVRWMGPIRPGSPAQYTFDELFWDDKGRIQYMRVTSVTFHFTDGTHRTFSGYEKILKHTLNP